MNARPFLRLGISRRMEGRALSCPGDARGETTPDGSSCEQRWVEREISGVVVWRANPGYDGACPSSSERKSSGRTQKSEVSLRCRKTRKNWPNSDRFCVDLWSIPCAGVGSSLDDHLAALSPAEIEWVVFPEIMELVITSVWT